MTALEAVAQLGEILELKIAVGTRTGGDLLLIDPQRIAHGMEQASDGIGGDGNAEFSQLFRDGGSGTARPPVMGSPAVSRSSRQWRTAIRSGVFFPPEYDHHRCGEIGR